MPNPAGSCLNPSDGPRTQTHHRSWANNTGAETRAYPKAERIPPNRVLTQAATVCAGTEEAPGRRQVSPCPGAVAAEPKSGPVSREIHTRQFGDTVN